MRLIRPYYKIMYDIQAPEMLIEQAGRTCYKSEDNITPLSARSFVSKLIERRHYSVIEHSFLMVRFVVDRGFTHELVRHRLCAFSQESTRYCNYKGGVTFIIPPWINIEDGEYLDDELMHIGILKEPDKTWFKSMLDAELAYQDLLADGWSPQQARSVLPNSLKTDIVVSANYREWRHILDLRTSKAAHPQMREIMVPLHHELWSLHPEVFTL